MITEAQWRRLQALDARCDLFMERRTEWQGEVNRTWLSIPGPGPTRRAWHVRIKIRGGIDAHDLIDTSRPALADAIEEALTTAESRSWHRPAQTDA
jgi:hypothetical protein